MQKYYSLSNCNFQLFVRHGQKIWCQVLSRRTVSQITVLLSCMVLRISITFCLMAWLLNLHTYILSIYCTNIPKIVTMQDVTHPANCLSEAQETPLNNHRPIQRCDVSVSFSIHGTNASQVTPVWAIKVSQRIHTQHSVLQWGRMCSRELLYRL